MQGLLMGLGVLLLFAASAQADDVEQVTDLVTPVMTEDAPEAGKRERQAAPEYDGTQVYHSLYLPVDWQPGGKHPVIVEYTGNRFPPGKGSGEVKTQPESHRSSAHVMPPLPRALPDNS